MVTLKAHDQLVINEAVERKLIKYFYRGVHENKEFCGLIAGMMGIANELIEIPNLSEGATYTFDPIAFNNELNKLDKESKELLAIFHTHPPNSLALSQFDIDNAKLNIAHIVVSSTMEPTDELPKVDYKGWLIKDKKPEEITIIAPTKRKPGADSKPSGFKIEITTDGLQAFVGMVEAYFGTMNIRRENRRIRDELSDERRRNLRRARRWGARRRDRDDDTSAVTGGLILNPANAELFGSDEDDDDPDAIAEDELEFERQHPDFADPPIHEKPKIPAHKHQYQWASDTPDGMNVYECNFPDCNNKLTVNGDIWAGKPTPLDPPVPFVSADAFITKEKDNKKEDTLLGQDEKGAEVYTQAQPPAYCWGCGEKIKPNAQIQNGFCVKCIKGESDKELIKHCFNCGDKLPEGYIFNTMHEYHPECEKCKPELKVMFGGFINNEEKEAKKT